MTDWDFKPAEKSVCMCVGVGGVGGAVGLSQLVSMATADSRQSLLSWRLGGRVS